MPVSTKPRDYAAKMRRRQNWIDAGRPVHRIRNSEALAQSEDIVRQEQERKRRADAPKVGWTDKISNAVGRFFQRRRA